MGFDRRNLPDPITYFEGVGLKLTGRGKWRTTECKFHGGSDSMRVNTDSGAFACMAGCGARGGDVLAYEMATGGLGFIEGAKELGAWVDDGKPQTGAGLGAGFTLLAAIEFLEQARHIFRCNTKPRIFNGKDQIIRL